MSAREQWYGFVGAASVLSGFAWANFWAMMLGPDTRATFVLALIGWVVAFAVSARNAFDYEDGR